MTKKPPSAKAKAAKAKREKAGVPSEAQTRVNNSYEKSWDPRTMMESAYPVPIKEGDLLSAEEAQAAEEQLLGKRGDILILDDDMPDFLQTAAKAGPSRVSETPVLDALGRIPKRERKVMDAVALGEHPTIPAIIASFKDEAKIRRAITVLRDHELEYPDLYMAVFVAGDWAVPDDEARFAKLFSRAGCYRAETVEEADIVVFGGGSDVEPLLYGEDNSMRHFSTYYAPDRDAADMKIYLQARSQGTPMMGVCRGAQFLHVMNGGKLYQDINGHQGAHKAWALREQMLIEKVSSVHHQSCVFNKEMEILLTTSQSNVRHLNKDVVEKSPKPDIEAFYYRDTGCFGVQGHPEYADCNKFSVWCLEKISDLFLCSPDFMWEDKRLQMTPAARDAKQIAEQYVENAYNQSKEA